MMYLRVIDCKYDVYIAQLDSDGNLPSNIQSNSLVSGTYDGEGYLTVNLNTPFNFTSTNKCAVIVKLTADTPYYKSYIPYEGTFQMSNTDSVINPEINSGESFYGTVNDQGLIEWNDCYTDDSYGVDGQKGNLIIRPILGKSTIISENITITPSEIIDNDSDVAIQIDTEVNLFAIKRSSDSTYLKQVSDYQRTDTGIILKADYINSLNNTYTELVFEFNDDITKTVTIIPILSITEVSVTGDPIIGDTLTASCVGNPVNDEYDVVYQWQSSLDGEIWTDIVGATSSSYTVTENVYNRYLRVKVNSVQNGNVSYPTEVYSDSTECKVVILGDVNLDGIVSINDCTTIQKYLASSTMVLTAEQLLAGDVNKDGVISVLDVTEIQKLLTA